jgi:hypothetical protein
VVDSENSPVSRSIRRLMPSVSQWLWLSLLLVLLAQPWRTMMVASDGDPCMHWSIGQWMLQHRHIIRADEFSHTLAGQPFVALAWLADILFATAGQLGGLYGLAVLAALLIATTFALLHRQLLREGNDILIATALVILAACAASVHWLARPLVFTHLIAFLYNDALRRFEHDGRTSRMTAVLSVLMLVWVNLHGGFFLGFAILGTYWMAALFEIGFAGDGESKAAARRRILSLTRAGLLCGAASLITPYGFHTTQRVFEFVRSPYLINWFSELSSTNFSSAGASSFVAWLGVIFFTLTLCRPMLSASSTLTLICWTYLALHSTRNIPLLAILTAPILAPVLSSECRRRWDALSLRLSRFNEAPLGWAIVGIAAVAAITGVPRPTEMPRDRWPAAAVDYVNQHPEQFTGNLFNQYIWGGYLMRVSPQHKVFVDGRADFYGESLIREFSDTTALGTNWTHVLQKYDIRWTLMPANHRLNLALALLPGWRCVYSDQVAEVFCKTP